MSSISNNAGLIAVPIKKNSLPNALLQLFHVPDLILVETRFCRTPHSLVDEI